MQKKENTRREYVRRKMIIAAAMSLSSLLVTLLLLLAAAFAIEKGKLPMEQKEKLVMICVFLGAVPTSFLLNLKEGRGALKTSAAACILYMIMLIILELAFGSETIFNPQLLKNGISVLAGHMFGCAIFAFRKPKHKRHNKRYNKQ